MRWIEMRMNDEALASENKKSDDKSAHDVSRASKNSHTHATHTHARTTHTHTLPHDAARSPHTSRAPTHARLHTLPHGGGAFLASFNHTQDNLIETSIYTRFSQYSDIDPV
jgi:hypothetical protein